MSNRLQVSPASNNETIKKQIIACYKYSNIGPVVNDCGGTELAESLSFGLMIMQRANHRLTTRYVRLIKSIDDDDSDPVIIEIETNSKGGVKLNRICNV